MSTAKPSRSRCSRSTSAASATCPFRPRPTRRSRPSGPRAATCSGSSFRTRLHGPCMRCLRDAVVDIAVDAREYHATAEDAPDDLRSEYVVDGELQLSQWARDSIATALPNQILCRTDCAGLCPVCGKDLNDEPHGHERDGGRSALGGARGVARGMTTLSPRARIVLVEHGKVALIRRVRDGHTYYLFPGGGVEDGRKPGGGGPPRGGRGARCRGRARAARAPGVVRRHDLPLLRRVDRGRKLRDGKLAGSRSADGSRAGAKRHPRARAGCHSRSCRGLDVRPRALGALLTP